MSKVYYFDNAATTWPKPEKVYSAAEKYLRNMCGNPGRSGNSISLEADRFLYEARETISSFFNVTNPSRIIFTLNATDALNIAIKGVARKGMHIIYTALEHNSVLRPLGRLVKEGVITATMVPCDNNGNPDMQYYKKSFRKETGLVVCNHASNVFGVISPIEKFIEIAHLQGVPVLVDGAQTGGLLNIDVEDLKADMIAFAGHKGLFGPPGTGFLYVREGLEIKPFREGGTGSHSEMDLQPENMPEHLEAGTLNATGIAGLIEGINFINETGINIIREHELECTKFLKDELKNINNLKIFDNPIPENNLSVVSLTIEGADCGSIGDILESNFGIICRTGLHCAPLAHKAFNTFPEGTVRLSPGYFTTESDIDYVIKAIKEIAALTFP